ncbi:uncharacterized protein LOC143555455 [Bidens hawaiensis]|uniref:uncharacterized protein LOC143555455 n=1 Tax=Bidens hawaiensis TaxID=980011 RepID=UPI00404A3ADA
MTHKHAFEAFDRALRDMLGQNGNMNNERPFGGKFVVFGGDFRQSLPVVQGDTRNNDGDVTFDIPDDRLIKDTSNPISQLLNFVYPSILRDYVNSDFFSVGALLAPTNEVVEEVNDRLLPLFPREEKEYLSSDSICPDENVRDTLQENMYSPDVLKY